MNAALISKCDLLVQNREAIIMAFPWDSPDMSLATASLYVGLGKEADVEKLKACQEILKKDVGIFSDYRGYVKMPLLCKMALAEDAEAYYQQIKSVVEQMQELKWIDKTYKILAAMTIHDHAEPSQYAEAISKMADLYQDMKKNHPWLTSGEDIPFAAMLAVSRLDTAALTEEMEKCYQRLTEFFHDKNAVQSLSHVLAADSRPTEEKCTKVEQIYTLLKTENHKFGSGTELAVLGTLSMLDLSAQTIVAEIEEADEYLKTKQGFGNFIMGKGVRRMYAALMVMDTHAPTSAGTDSVVDIMLSLVVAMEILLIIMMCSVCVSVSAGN